METKSIVVLNLIVSVELIYASKSVAFSLTAFCRRETVAGII
jgi:hypothetical protein